VCFSKLDHLRNCLGRKDGKQVGDQQEPRLLVANVNSRLDLAESDAFSIVGASSSSIDEGRVESVDVEVLVVDEETFTNSGISVVESHGVKSKPKVTGGNLLNLVLEECAFVCSNDLALVCEDGGSVPVLLALEFDNQFLCGTFNHLNI
jgi:hypothetical protein